MASQLSMAMFKEFHADISMCAPMSEGCVISDINSYAFFDAHAFIFLGYEITIEYPAELSTASFVKNIFKGRQLFENLGLQEIHRLNSHMLLETVKNSFIGLGLKPDEEEIKLEDDKTLPALFLSSCKDDLYEIFSNEETREQFEGAPILSVRGYSPTFFSRRLELHSSADLYFYATN